MKVPIETSIYLIVMALIALISIDFISMNMGVTRVSEMNNYVADYLEIYGESNEDGTIINEETVHAINEKINKYGMEFKYTYESSTESYNYYEISIEYAVQSRLFKFSKKHSYDGMARVSKETAEASPVVPAA